MKRIILKQPLFRTEGQTSTDTETNIVLAYVYPWQNKLVYIKENNVNAISYRIDGSMDKVNWVNLHALADIGKNGDDYQTLTDAWVWIRVQIKSTAAGTHSTDVDCWIGVN